MYRSLLLLCLAVCCTTLISAGRLDHSGRFGFSGFRSGFKSHRRSPSGTLSHPAIPDEVFHRRGRTSSFIRRPFIPILRYNQYGPIDGVYSFDFETGNGIRRDERGEPSGPNGAVVSQGSWSFTLPDGTPAEFTFVADENGYQPQSSLIPVPPPMPAHAIAQIRKAERERAQGIFHDGQYYPERYQ